MPLFDPTFYSNEQQATKKIEQLQEKNDANKWWAIAVLFFCLAVIFLLPYVTTNWRME